MSYASDYTAEKLTLELIRLPLTTLKGVFSAA